MKNIILALNPLEPVSWTSHDVQDVREFLMEQFSEWPATARIYHEQVSSAHDITPSCEADIDRLGELEGQFYVIVYPGEPITIIYAIVAIIVVAAVVMAAQANVPTPSMRNTQNQSANNELSERSNKPRPLARIPDIFGTVRSTPDLLAVPYKIFQDHEEVEYAYMCIGRGAYDVSDVRDDTTLAVDIAGTSVEVYAPNTSPNSGHDPQLRVGQAINTPLLDVVRSNAVNGQVLRAPNDQNLRGNSNIRFSAPNEIQLNPTSGLDFTDKFAAGDNLTLARAIEYDSYANETRTIVAYSAGYFRFEIPSSTLPPLYQAGKECVLTGALFSGTDSDGFWSYSYDLSGIYEIASVALESEVITPEFGSPYTQYYCRVNLVSPSSVNPKWAEANGTTSTSAGIRLPDGSELYNLNGTYSVLAVSDTTITLSDPSSVNSEWSAVTVTNYVSPILSTTGSKWVGPFVLDKKDTTQVFCNFVALNGLYKDDGKNQARMDVTIELEVTPINADGSIRGAAQTFQATVEGSATFRSTRAVTLKATPVLSGRLSIRARRVTPSDLAFEGSVVDEIKWRDVYAVATVLPTHFGNVTTVQSVTYATAGALALKERKLNMLVTRKIPARISGSTFSTELYATNRADHILSAVCLDPHIGNRPASEIDFDAIYTTMAEVRSYFGHDVAGEFSYTFDSDNLSFEETAQAIANAVFCIAYRRGNIIKLNFERETQDSTLLFNHRNKLPGSETRTIRFGNQNNFDGVSFQYADPTDDALVTYYIPEDRSAINPREIESLGVRSRLQAYFHAWRAWNKIRYQNVIIEFQATQEADLLVNQDRILVADNTRTQTQDGEVILQNALQLTMSQPVVMQSGVSYTIFLQLPDGTVESIPATAGTTDRNVVLSRAPRLPLAIEDGLYARTTFILVGDDDPRENAFLVAEKVPQSNFTSTVRAVNYDERYYSSDEDFINGVVNSNGEYL
jgi:hypothetical protein